MTDWMQGPDVMLALTMFTALCIGAIEDFKTGWVSCHVISSMIGAAASDALFHARYIQAVIALAVGILLLLPRRSAGATEEKKPSPAGKYAALLILLHIAVVCNYLNYGLRSMPEKLGFAAFVAMLVLSRLARGIILGKEPPAPDTEKKRKFFVGGADVAAFACIQAFYPPRTFVAGLLASLAVTALALLVIRIIWKKRAGREIPLYPFLCATAPLRAAAFIFGLI